MIWLESRAVLTGEWWEWAASEDGFGVAVAWGRVLWLTPHGEA